MSQEKVALPTSERQRKLQQLTFAPSSILTRDLPKDTVLKELQLRLHGAITTTYASGTPVSDAQAYFDNLVPRVDVVINGSRTVKSVKPHLMAMQQLFTTLIRAERASSSGASAANDDYPTADGVCAFGTTGQITTIRETCLISFENVYARIGKESTWLNLKGVASAEVRLTTAAYAALQGFGNTAPVVYSASTFVVDIITKEAQDVPPQIAFSDWKQTTKQVTFSAQTTGYLIDVNRGNKLQGIMLFVRDGQSGSSTTASGKLATNLGVTDIALIVNGQSNIKTTDFKALQAENRAKYGVSAAFASNVSQLDGVAYLDLLARGDLSTALNVAPPMVDNVQLQVSTNNSTNVSYTNPVSVEMMTDEIVTPR